MAASTATAAPAGNHVKFPVNTKGEFVRPDSIFRNWVAADSAFAPEADRYHLYVSLACPWAHRTLIYRAIKGLEDAIGLSVVDYLMLEKGWKFSTAEETAGCIPDSVNNAQYLREVYLKADPEYKGRITVPVLWDKKLNTIVNNESPEIIRIFNKEFNHLSSSKEKATIDLYPEHLRAEIDELNSWIYPTINNGVYKSGFATSQQAYEDACKTLFASLERVEGILSDERRFLTGRHLTEADVRLFTTIVRFDPVYHTHFKCNIKRIQDYPHLLRWLRRVHSVPGIAPTVDMVHIKRHYYESHAHINPHRICPLGEGPDLNVDVEPGVNKEEYFYRNQI